MPPEQAQGRLDAIDRRSDIYSLGAILYELLTLEAPVKKDAGFAYILVQVLQGTIQPPAQRTPERARRGLIPAELAAVAMKALAKEPGQRYQTVEEMRRDIERFQEGRSVSAKADTLREVVFKFVKRNKGVSAATAAAAVLLAVVLAVAFRVNFAARVRAETAQQTAEKEQERAEASYAALEREQREKREAEGRLVPAFVTSGRHLASDGRIEDAQQQIDAVLSLDPESAEALLLKAQLRIARKDWAGGRADLQQYVRLRPGDADARKLLDLCPAAGTASSAVVMSMADVLQRQRMFGLARLLLRDVRDTVAALQPLLRSSIAQIERKWPGLGETLKVDMAGRFVFHVYKKELSATKDLEPLRDIPLSELSIGDASNLTNLSALEGMPLNSLTLLQARQLENLKPLSKLPLRSLRIGNCPALKDVEPFKDLPLTALDIRGSRVQTLLPIQGVSLKSLNITWAHTLDTLEPLEDMLSLTSLDMGSCEKIRTLKPLRNMRLTHLNITHCWLIDDLKYLEGMPLEELTIMGCTKVTDLKSLSGMPLRRLNCMGTKVTSLGPLEGMDLEFIAIDVKNIREGLELLKEMNSLTTIEVPGDGPMSREAFWKKYGRPELPK
jgi:tetratricopeptide (TPR) repeat protein